VDTVLDYVALTGAERVVDAYCGVGTLTAFLSSAVDGVLGIDVNADAVADAAVNLAEAENVFLYEGAVEEILPMLEIEPDVVVVNPPDDGMSRDALQAVVATGPLQLVYVSSEVATLARDGKHLSRAGYRLVEVQPIDIAPQTDQIDTVSLWELP
jgi:23S rRNA (uracil1939-C5)-methyltransferase